MISIENVEREKTIYLKGHFEKVPILPDVIIKAKENSIFFFLKWLYQKSKPKSEKEHAYEEHRAGYCSSWFSQVSKGIDAIWDNKKWVLKYV